MTFPWLKQAAASDVDGDSTMVAIYPPKGWVDLLAAHAHPSQRDKLHAMLVYLGKTTPRQAQKALRVVQKAVAKHAPVKMKCNGVGIFDNPDAVVRVINPNGIGLTELRAAIYTALDKEGLVATKTHGFLPHMTLEYHEDRRLPENWERVAQLPFGQWTVKDVRVVRGDKEIGRASLTGTKEAQMTPFAQGYARVMKLAQLDAALPEQPAAPATPNEGGIPNWAPAAAIGGGLGAAVLYALYRDMERQRARNAALLGASGGVAGPITAMIAAGAGTGTAEAATGAGLGSALGGAALGGLGYGLSGGRPIGTQLGGLAGSILGGGVGGYLGA